MNTDQTKKIIFDDITVNIQRKKNIKRLSIKIDPNKGVFLNLPFYISESLIYPFLESARPWLKKHYRAIQPLNFMQGEEHLYLGIHYPLNLIPYQQRPYVVFDNHKLNVYCDQQERLHIQKLLHCFYQTEAHRLFSERLLACMQLTPWVIKTPELKYRFMRSRYGSCSNLGNISLNTHLIKAPVELIDYVILHELCHIKEHNHSSRFYALMQHVQPNWQQLKAQLQDFCIFDT